jgi:transcriptional regulator of acetoin/glycerol metabolism
MTRSAEIGIEDLPDTLVMAAGDAPAPAPAASEEGATALGRGGFFDERARRMNAFEKEYLVAMLKQHRGDVTSAAREAGIPRGTYYRLMKNHGLRANDFRRETETV